MVHDGRVLEGKSQGEASNGDDGVAVAKGNRSDKR